MQVKEGIAGIGNTASVKLQNRQQGSSHSTPEKTPVPSTEDADTARAASGEEHYQACGGRHSDSGHTLSNAFDAIALIETAESAIGRIFATLQQARELAQQANDSEQYTLLNKKFQQQLDTMDGIAATTRFKGNRILQGGLGYAYFRLDLGSGKLICIDLDTSLRRSAIGTIASASSASLNHLFGSSGLAGCYTTPPIRDLNFFTAPRHASFDVDGIPTGLFRDWRDRPEQAAAALQERLNARHGTDTYSVSHNNHCFTISQRSGKAPVLSAASMRGTEFIGGASRSVPQPMRLTLATGDFTLQVGDGPSINIVGRFSHLAELAAAVNSQLAEGTAHANLQTNTLEISAGKTLTLGGKLATSSAGLGFFASSYPPGGNLSSARLLDAATSSEALLRIDAALTTVTAQRISYSKLKQRFHQAITEIQANHQRAGTAPHIADATLAAESLARACSQLPQQASTTVQAQANAAANKVKMLLSQDFQEAPLSFCYLRCEKGKERCP